MFSATANNNNNNNTKRQLTQDQIIKEREREREANRSITYAATRYGSDAEERMMPATTTKERNVYFCICFCGWLYLCYALVGCGNNDVRSKGTHIEGVLGADSKSETSILTNFAFLMARAFFLVVVFISDEGWNQRVSHHPLIEHDLWRLWWKLTWQDKSRQHSLSSIAIGWLQYFCRLLFLRISISLFSADDIFVRNWLNQFCNAQQFCKNSLKFIGP